MLCSVFKGTGSGVLCTGHCADPQEKGIERRSRNDIRRGLCGHFCRRRRPRCRSKGPGADESTGFGWNVSPATALNPTIPDSTLAPSFSSPLISPTTFSFRPNRAVKSSERSKNGGLPLRRAPKRILTLPPTTVIIRRPPRLTSIHRRLHLQRTFRSSHRGRSRFSDAATLSLLSIATSGLSNAPAVETVTATTPPKTLRCKSAS